MLFFSETELQGEGWIRPKDFYHADKAAQGNLLVRFVPQDLKL